jgi:hypothetical protein
MGETMLVETHKADGKRLLERLIEDGFPVTAAAWFKEGVDGSWYLYVVTPAVEDGAKREAFGRIEETKRKLEEPFWIGPGEIRLIAPSHRIAKAILELQRRYQGDRAIELGHGETQLGGMTISGAYIYPPHPHFVA